jgi:hypothetical protein
MHLPVTITTLLMNMYKVYFTLLKLYFAEGGSTTDNFVHAPESALEKNPLTFHMLTDLSYAYWVLKDSSYTVFQHAEGILTQNNMEH